MENYLVKELFLEFLGIIGKNFDFFDDNEIFSPKKVKIWFLKPFFKTSTSDIKKKKKTNKQNKTKKRCYFAHNEQHSDQI